MRSILKFVGARVIAEGREVDGCRRFLRTAVAEVDATA
jgi:hypothetical protein